MHLSSIALAFAAVAGAAALGCSTPTANDCSFAAVIEFSPAEVTMQVRDTLTVSAQFGPVCAGAPGNRAGVFHWKSSDPSIVTVDSVTGTLRGVSPGQTTVVAHDTVDASLTSPLPVLVTPRQNGG